MVTLSYRVTEVTLLYSNCQKGTLTSDCHLTQAIINTSSIVLNKYIFLITFLLNIASDVDYLLTMVCVSNSTLYT